MKNWKVAVGSLSSWSGWIIVTILGLRLLVALISDPNRTQNYSPLWLITWLAGVTGMVLLVLVAMKLGLKKLLQSKPRPTANLLLIAATGVLGNYLVAITAEALDLDHEPLWLIRLGGGALASVLEFVLINSLRASFVARQESIRKLKETESRLQGYRESAKQIIADEIEKLQARTREALIPSIERIQNLVAERTHTRSNLVDDLKRVINNEVRPLSKEVLAEADHLARLNPQSQMVYSPQPILPRKFPFKQSIRPGIAAAIFGATFPMIEFMFIDHRSAFRGLLGGLSTGLVLAIVKLITPKTLELKATIGTLLTIAISVLAVTPSAWIMWQEYGLIKEVTASIAFQVFAAILGTLLLSYTKALELNQEKQQRTLTEYTDELHKEVALFEQKLSLEKRAWSRIIHGEVQSALTAAATRLQRSEHLEPYEIELVRQDLNRAKENLTNPKKQITNFTQTIQEITKTWQSIANITIDIDPRAKRALDHSEDTREVTLEIINEAISNAIRHGDANEIKVNLSRELDDILEIEIQNNGTKIDTQAKKGLGSQMFDELTLTWHFDNKNQTTLKAQVPISKN